MSRFGDMASRPLAGRRVVTTRDRRSRLDALLAAAGADVIHVPLIRIEPPLDARLDAALEALHTFDWLVVTSRHGAARVGPAAAGHPGLRLAAVGSATAAVLAEAAGRAVDVVPARQTGADLVLELAGHSGRALIAQADRADGTIASGLGEHGFVVEVVTAYRTVLRSPTWRERAAIETADGVGFASGSAVDAWADAIGTDTPPVAVAIGPTTQAVAARRGLKITHVATDHDVEGLVEALTVALANSRRIAAPGPVRGPTERS